MASYIDLDCRRFLADPRHLLIKSSSSVEREAPPCLYPLTDEHSDVASIRRAKLRCLFVLGEAEVEAAVAGVEPAAGDGFAAGEEVHAFGAVGVAVAEQ
jgi:hypothetical protein